MRLWAQIADKKEHEKKKGTIDSIAVSVSVDQLAELDKSEANPKNNLMMRQAGFNLISKKKRHELSEMSTLLTTNAFLTDLDLNPESESGEKLKQDFCKNIC